MNVILRRNNVYRDNTVTGNLSIYENEILLYKCKTLENFQLRIKKGEYLCNYTYSPKFNRMLYLINGAYRRYGIRIHAGNTVKNTSGCILLGKKIVNEIKLTSSKKTLEEFHEITNSKIFKLNII